MSRVGAELVADKPEEVEAGVTQAEQAFSASNRSTFETSMPKSQYELSQLSQLAESGSIRPPILINKTPMSEEPSQGKSNVTSVNVDATSEADATEKG